MIFRNQNPAYTTKKRRGNSYLLAHLAALLAMAYWLL
jgi:hypothetical protein